RPERLGVSKALLVRLIDRGLELCWSEAAWKVDQRADRRGNWDAVVSGEIIGSERGAPVDDNARRTWINMGRYGDLHAPTPHIPDVPKCRGALVAEHRLGAAREDRRHPSTFLGQLRPAHCIDTSQDEVQTTPSDP